MSQVLVKPASATVEASILNEPPKQEVSQMRTGSVWKGTPDKDGQKAQLTLQDLPKSLQAQLIGCPSQGNGVHFWLFKTALQLNKYFGEEEIVAILQDKLSCIRPEREIRDAVANSGKIARGEVTSFVSSETMASSRLCNDPQNCFGM